MTLDRQGERNGQSPIYRQLLWARLSGSDGGFTTASNITTRWTSIHTRRSVVPCWLLLGAGYYGGCCGHQPIAKACDFGPAKYPTPSKVSLLHRLGCDTVREWNLPYGEVWSVPSLVCFCT
jgi:hypothetical protein